MFANLQDFSLVLIWQACQRTRLSEVESSLTSTIWPPWGSLGTAGVQPSASRECEAGIDRSIYIGQYYDAATGLSYLNSRYYNAAQGQFISEDSVFLGNPKYQNLGNPQTLNAYSYSQDNPIVIEDPNGTAGLAASLPSIGYPSFYSPGQGLTAFSPTISPSVNAGASSLGQTIQNHPYIAMGVAITTAAVVAAPFTFGGSVGAGLSVDSALISAEAAGTAAATCEKECPIAESAADHIVLGLRSGLDATASQVGGRTLLSDPAWMNTLQDAIANGATKFTLSLNGLSGGSSAFSKVISAAQAGSTFGATATNWEIAQLYQAGILGNVNLIENGVSVSNPFTQW
jgi:RHS repeat-associated protein